MLRYVLTAMIERHLNGSALETFGSLLPVREGIFSLFYRTKKKVLIQRSFSLTSRKVVIAVVVVSGHFRQENVTLHSTRKMENSRAVDVGSMGYVGNVRTNRRRKL